MARSLVVSGLLPVMGIHHHNRYNVIVSRTILWNHRPFVDKLVIEIRDKMEIPENLNTEIKRELLSIPVLDVKIEGKRSPLIWLQ